MTRRPTFEAVQKAICVILSDRANYEKSLNYAVNYCEAALILPPEALRLQCLYIVTNIVGWRHPKAKAIRKILNHYSKP